MKYIFLDIDGVLNGHEKHANNYCGTRADCVERFNRILAAHPAARVVISSSWRYAVTRGRMTLEGFGMMLLTHGVCIHGRLAGCTREEAFIDEPRLNQIRDWLAENDADCEDWISLDDLPMHDSRCFLTDGVRGLTAEDAERIVSLGCDDGCSTCGGCGSLCRGWPPNRVEICLACLACGAAP